MVYTRFVHVQAAVHTLNEHTSTKQSMLIIRVVLLGDNSRKTNADDVELNVLGCRVDIIIRDKL